MRRWVLLYFIMVSGCQMLAPPKPLVMAPLTNVWDGKLYLGDSLRQGVAQSKLSPVISCLDAKFDNMVCMSVEDYTALMQYFLRAACVNQ